MAPKTKCVDVLENIISMENCTNVMLVADEINNSRLREACLHFGIKNINRIPGKSSMLYSSSTYKSTDTEVENPGTVDEEEKEAEDNCHEMDIARPGE